MQTIERSLLVGSTCDEPAPLSGVIQPRCPLRLSLPVDDARCGELQGPGMFIVQPLIVRVDSDLVRGWLVTARATGRGPVSVYHSLLYGQVVV